MHGLHVAGAGLWTQLTQQEKNKTSNTDIYF